MSASALGEELLGEIREESLDVVRSLPRLLERPSHPLNTTMLTTSSAPPFPATAFVSTNKPARRPVTRQAHRHLSNPTHSTPTPTTHAMAYPSPGSHRTAGQREAPTRRRDHRRHMFREDAAALLHHRDHTPPSDPQRRLARWQRVSGRPH